MLKDAHQKVMLFLLSAYEFRRRVQRRVNLAAEFLFCCRKCRQCGAITDRIANQHDVYIARGRLGAPGDRTIHKGATQGRQQGLDRGLEHTDQSKGCLNETVQLGIHGMIVVGLKVAQIAHPF